ncbi:urea ABC transporter substrate-binding protein [Burkholderia sp. THE68]|uniref:urea ABC transporter substrate-binding protein n=1 Tax=Burkholderia sp. THE68 TaxID=758782 RepID=UPI001315D552|nr:transporter substrate-binding protein [Burkholderia sp. THE68]BBU30352.1 urea ABC transporter substrate-binding protein [Burkholderia sp. THE68]
MGKFDSDEKVLGNVDDTTGKVWSSRRKVIKLSVATAGAVLTGQLMPMRLARADSGEIHVASMFDLTGNLNIYGVQAMNVSKYAIEAINKSGGVLGKKLVLHAYDTQSKIELYSRYAQEIGSDDRVAAVVGCFTGASREAARPVLSRYGKILFFPTIDEGGECDKLTFMQGSDCLQQEAPLIEWAAKNVGKTFYIVAADYVYGHVATAWTQSLVSKQGGTIKGIEYVPLDVSDFGSTIRKIQTAGPAVVMSNLVGNNHIAFYRQFAAAGLNKHIKIISPTFGLGNEQKVLTPEEASGIVVAYSYFESIDTPANKQFIDGFRKMFPNAGPISDPPAQVWNGWQQWKVAVEKAGTTDTAKVVAALESGIPYVGPSGKVSTDGSSHRNIQDIHLANVSNQQGYEIIQSFSQVKPSREVVGAGACDLTGKDAASHRMINPRF